MTAVTEPLVYSARPEIEVDGTNAPSLADTLLTLLVEEDVDGLRHCEATFLNWGPMDGTPQFLHFDRRLLDFGKKLSIGAGSGVGSGQIFEGKITALEGRFLRDRAHEFLILAEDRLQELRMTRRTRSFEQMSDADVIRKVAGDHGLRADLDLTGPTHRVLAQVNQSDLAFLRERARAADAELWVEGDTLHAVARGRRRNGEAICTLGRGLHECSIAADLAGQTSGFVVSGWDVSAKRGIRHRATESVLSGELDQLTGAGSILSRALGTRDQQIVHHAPFTTEEAQALAEAHFRASARRFVRCRATAELDARIRVGARVELREVGPLFTGRYYVTRTLHLYDGIRGLRTQFECERPGLGG